MRPILIYCYDAYCGWCYGFSSVMERITRDYASFFQIEVLSGGMILPSQPIPIHVTAPLIKELYPTVSEKTGVSFGADFLWHIHHPDLSDWFPSSEMPAVALNVFKSFLPEHQVEMAAFIQKALFQEGRDLTDPEAYRHIVEYYRIPPDFFYARLNDPYYKELAYGEFETCRQLKVTGYPQLFCQLNESKIQLLSSGFTEESILRNRIQQVLDAFNVKPA